MTVLNTLVDNFWAEIADYLPKIENLYEDEKFPARNLAALLASKVFYHLGSFEDAMQFALGADTLFDLSDDSEFVTTLTAKFIDEYKRLRNLEFQSRDSQEPPKPIDPRMTSIVERMFVRCFEDGLHKQALGVALECLRLDIAERAILDSNDVKGLLQYCFVVSKELVLNFDFRHSVFELLVKLYRQSEVRDYMNLCRCLLFLDKSNEIAFLFDDLLKSSNPDDNLLVYQIAFELVDNASQLFLSTVRSSLPPVSEAPEPSEETYTVCLRQVHNILKGDPTINFYLEFLYRNNHADIGVLKKIKSLFEPRISVLHTATIVSNAIMHCGTTRDTFLRDNLEWLSKAVNWAKFTTTAGLGVIHKGHLKEAYTVLDPYLPKQDPNASPFTEGGSLFAFGLIHAKHGHGKVSEYLLQQLKNIDTAPMLAQGGGTGAGGSLDAAQKKEIVQHGAALGLGVAAMGSGNMEVLEELQSMLYSNDSAVAGEAAGLAMGLVMLGSATEHSAEMLNFAHSTQHEKIIRSLGLGLAFTVCGLEERADPMIETLTTDKDPILRYGGQFAIGLAYAGTANNKAIRKLLHVAVSDVSDDVRRAAVMCLGFVLFRQPEQVPRLVTLLSESYNPHVRYGATIALGIACSGTGMKEAIALLEPLMKDSVPFVRQGAFIALAMILIQVSEKMEPKAKEIRQQLMEIVGDNFKQQSPMAKFGAIIALGIIDAGGRNMTIALSSRVGHMNVTALVGIAVFIQYWYWYPFLLFISLALTPTAIIAVNSTLEMPKYKIKSNAKPSLFAYPAEVKEVEEKAVKAVPTAQLSITKKQQRKEKKKTEEEKEKKKDEMEIEKPEEKPAEVVAVPVVEKPEPEFELLDNPARVTRAQLKYITFDVDPRYVPITEGVHGVILLKDTKPGESEDIIQGGVPTLTVQDDADEPEPPESFVFLG
uniref:Uncharacterized protein n=1 Tax=Arcella intermedia TaxID=1963864 RepID=A0A6B2KX95_9EUKA